MAIDISGLCKCDSDLWRWQLKESTLTLTCSQCGEEAEFTVMFPVLSILDQALKMPGKGGN